MDIPRRQLEAGMLRQMDIQNAMYPDSIPVLDVPGGMDRLEFARLVESSFPAVLNGAVDFPALKWNTTSLREKIGSLECQVAETPYGNADSPSGALFVKPHIRRMAVSDFLNLLESERQDGTVRYMQSQDGNLSTEFRPLIPDAPDIPWATEVIGQSAEAVNLWIGDNRTTSRLHNDNYENLFIQITGQKTFYLIPPINTYALDERFLVDATYSKTTNDEFVIRVDGTDIEIPSHYSDTQIAALLESTNTGRKILFPTVDPADGTTHNQIYRQHCKVYKVALNAGQMLFIPALWYHQVSITDPAVSISLNYWYPASTIKPTWALWDYLRVTSTLLRGYHDPDFFGDDEEDDDDLIE